MDIVTIVGARPQFVKAAVISRALSELEELNDKIIHTGQHYDNNMSDVFFEEMNIPKPDINLGIGGGTHGQNTGRMLEKIEEVLLSDRPDCVLVYGDTDSTLAATLAAVKLHIPVAHVEAGLRSYNRKMPEEINRILTDHASTYLFSPTTNATTILKNEGIDNGKIFELGDVMYDATIYYTELANQKSKIMKTLGLKVKDYVLATVHRAENVDNDEKIRTIFSAFSCCDVEIILPLHPRTRKRIKDLNIQIGENVKLIEPIGYFDMIKLESNAKLIVTDSGGVQKEAYFHKVPCVTLRDQTEWTELVETGWNNLCTIEKDEIIKMVTRDHSQGIGIDLYGSGNAGKLIAKTLKKELIGNG